MTRLQSAAGFVSPFAPPHAAPNIAETRLALLLHLAKRLGWLRRADDDRVRLTGNRVYAFLEQTRPEQRFTLWEAWRVSPEWNDLERIPGLDCSAGDWRNNPLQTREIVLQRLAALQPGAWYSQTDLIAAVKETAPDFQRPTGDYDSWYIRDENTQEFLRGFEHWEQVEGALLRFLFGGPLYWLSAIDLAEPSAGDDLLLSLSGWGARWLGHDSALPNEARRPHIIVEDDFTVRLPARHIADRPLPRRTFQQLAGQFPQLRLPHQPPQPAKSRRRRRPPGPHPRLSRFPRPRDAAASPSGAATIRPTACRRRVARRPLPSGNHLEATPKQW